MIIMFYQICPVVPVTQLLEIPWYNQLCYEKNRIVPILSTNRIQNKLPPQETLLYKHSNDILYGTNWYNFDISSYEGTHLMASAGLDHN